MGYWLCLVAPCQDQKAFPPETIPEIGEPEGQTPKENLEKDLMEDRGEAKTLQSQEPELLKGPGEYLKPWNSVELVTPSYGGTGLGSQHYHPWIGGVETMVQCQPPSSMLQSPTVQAFSLVAWWELLSQHQGSSEAGSTHLTRLVKCGAESLLSADFGSVERYKNPQGWTGI